MSLILQGSTSGSVTLQEPAVAGTTVLTLPATSGNVVVDSATQTLTNKTIEGGTVISGTAVSASSTSVDFTSIPSWVKRITVMFSGVSTNGSSVPIVQLGTSGSPATTGYFGGSTGLAVGTLQTIDYTTGFAFRNDSTSSRTASGQFIFSLLSSSTNTWVMTGGVYLDSAIAGISFGSKSLSGTLNMIRLTTVNGTDTFDAGSVNILYE